VQHIGRFISMRKTSIPHLFGLVLILLLGLSSCATVKPYYSALECMDTHVPIHRVTIKTEKYSQTEFDIVRCSFPDEKTCSKIDLDVKYKSGIYTQCNMPSGKVCTYKYGPNDITFYSKTFKIERDTSLMYGIRIPDCKNSKYCDLVPCNVDIGFLAIKGEGVKKITSWSHLQAVGRSSTESLAIKDEIMRITNPEVDNGLVRIDRALILTGYSHQGYHIATGYKGRIRKQDGALLGNWDNIQPQRITYNYKLNKTDEHKEYDVVSGQKALFDIGDSVAFVTTDWKGGYDRGLFGDKKSDIIKGKKGETRELHIFDKNFKEIKTLKNNEFRIQPMLVDRDKGGLVWKILGPLKAKKKNKNQPQLYGFLNSKGEFSPPPGTLGVYPGRANVPAWTPTRPFKVKSLPMFWFVAYKDRKNGVVWGMADSKLTEFSEPEWSQVRDMPGNWMFAKQIKSRKWEFFDGPNMNLSTEPEMQKLRSAEDGVAKIVAIMKQRKRIEKSAMARRGKLDRKQRRIAEAERRAIYNSAKRSGNVKAMRDVMGFDSDLAEDFYKSGHGSTQDLKKHLIRKGSVRNALHKELSKREKAYKVNLKKELKETKARGLAAKAEKARISAENRRASKERERAEWRNTVNSNTKSVNERVKKSWNKHKEEMYKKGYINNMN
jgi:hypothetical protein